MMDVVGYSKLLIEEQREILDDLNAIVRNTDQFRAAESAGKLVRLPTGDGLALVFFSSPDAPVRCASEIAQLLKQHPSIQLRMGIHSGPVSAVADVNQNSNIAGAGINLAQRVMDCGDAGHILLSKHAAEDLEHYRDWQPLLHDVGVVEVKHGLPLNLVNLYNNEIGNPAVPTRCKLLVNRTTGAGFKWLFLLLTTLLMLAGVGALLFYLTKRAAWRNSSLPILEKSIAVLPFENLSHDPENAYFADGIQEEILTRLAKIADLKVISRTSTARYKSSPDNLREIARQLGVAHVVEGSVQRASDQVRVNVQLIKAESDAHLWAETYDRKIADIFAVESEVARAIADSLQARLSLDERTRVEKKPTSNTAAYDLYLQARAYHHRGLANITMEEFENARRLYEKTLSLDPNFALAHAHLSATLGAIFHWFEPTPEVKAEARREADEALRLDPGLPEAHEALGLWLYWTERRYEDALNEFNVAARAMPNAPGIITDIAAIRRRQGRWDEATSGFRQALALDPRNPAPASEVAFSLMFQRKWKEASEAAQTAVALGPDLVNLRIRTAYLGFWWKNDTNALRTVVGSIPADVDPSGVVSLARWDLAMLERDFDRAQRALDACKLDLITPYGTPLPRSFLQGSLEAARGNPAQADVSFEAAREIFEHQVQLAPDDGIRRAALATVYAFLARHDDAMREARKAMELIPESADAVLGPTMTSALALVYVRAGKNDEAIDLIGRLLLTNGGIDTGTGGMTVPDLRRRWQWDPLRNDARFQELLTRFEDPDSGR